MTTYIKETVANIEKLFGIELTDEQEEQLTYIIADAIQAGSNNLQAIEARVRAMGW